MQRKGTRRRSGTFRVAAASRTRIGPALKQGEIYPYEIIKHNARGFERAMTVDIVMGITAANGAVDYYNGKLSSEERDAGWSHTHVRTTKKPWNKCIKRKLLPSKHGPGEKR